ncbi:MAG: exocyst complex protein Exo70 [Amphiamblys sp. WSBS2006]|nr:MAG: exocyst complex protein Exo70 [Amphiamblys sp. WSBS2006]
MKQAGAFEEDLASLTQALDGIRKKTKSLVKTGKENKEKCGAVEQKAQTMLTMNENIRKTEDCIREIERIQQLERDEAEKITGGPELFPVETFIESMKRLTAALKQLKAAEFRETCSQTEARMDRLYRGGLETTRSAVLRWLKEYSAPGTGQKTDDAVEEEGVLRISGIPLGDLKDQKLLCDFLFATEKIKDVEAFLASIIQVRNEYLKKTLKRIVDKTKAFDLEKPYKNGTHPLTAGLPLFAGLLGEEALLCSELFTEKIAKRVLSEITSDPIADAKKMARAMIESVRIQSAEGNITACVVVFDLLFSLNRFACREKIAPIAKENVVFFIEILVRAAKDFFNTLLESVGSIGKQKNPVPRACGVQPVVISGFSVFRRLLNNMAVVETILYEKSDNAIAKMFLRLLKEDPNAFGISNLLYEMMKTSINTINAASKSYKLPAERLVYRMNNYAYILNTIKTPPLDTVATEEIQEELSTPLEQTRQEYLAEWADMAQVLVKQGPDGIAPFLEALDAVAKTQTQMALQDRPMKTALLKEIRGKVIGKYKSAFSMSDKKNTVSPEIVEGIVLDLFQG